jgi:hypothetical protein
MWIVVITIKCVCIYLWQLKLKLILRQSVSRSVGQFLLVSGTTLRPMTRYKIYFCLTITCLFMQGALSDERTGP